MPPVPPTASPRQRGFLVLFSLALLGLQTPALAAGNPLTLSGKPLPDWFKFYPAEHKVSIDPTYIKMPDGVQLAVTYYKPADASPKNKYPIVINIVPYRKDDIFYAGDYGMYYYLAERGIACARIDIRGTGGSEGVEVDREYSDAELNDLEACIGLMAALPWCNGSIGMQGKSWAGFNAFMMAMRQPPALKALIAAHASEDLYANDVHNWDGILHLDIFTEEIETESLMPRSPDYVLDADYFKNRFAREPWVFTYLDHQRDGKFWRDGRSLFTAYDRVKIPIYAIGGLLDGYRDFAVSVLDHIKSPVKAEFGPWNHAWPNAGSPGPRYNNWQTAVRWWKQWLETTLIDSLKDGSQVDGHDAGSGEMNIFIFTDDPTVTFAAIQNILGSRDFWIDARVAYREADRSDYTILWPKDLAEFKVC